MDVTKVVWLALRMPQELEILGVFETEADAAAVATKRRDVIGPLPMGVAFPDAPWEGAYYPLASWKSVGELPAIDVMTRLMDLGRCRCVVDGADQLDGSEV